MVRGGCQTAPDRRESDVPTSIKKSQAQGFPKKSRKPRRPLTLQALHGMKRPTVWLRSLISPLDFGVKATKIGAAGERVTKPVHCNTNAEVQDAFRHGDWHRIERLSNPMLDDHWDGRRTYYYTCNGSTRHRHVLVNIDIDCHASGSPRGAAGAAEHLGGEFFPDLYHEPSTHEEGRHGYFILDKGDLGAGAVKTLLKELERALNGYLLAQGFDIELCEIKGLPPVVSWGEDDMISNYTSGILAKIPRQVDRFEEWKGTTVINEFRLRKLITKLRSLTPEVTRTPSAATTESNPPAARPKVSGSIGGKLVGEEELAQFAEEGHYRRVAVALMETHVLKTSGRSVVTAEDVAAFLLLLKFFTNRMNADGTLPVKRFEGLWTGLYEAGDVGRAFDCHRFKTIRDYLSDLGLIDWVDNNYVVPRIDETGKMRKGRACKWKAGRVLMDMLAWEGGRRGGEESGEIGHDEVVDDDDVQEGEEDEAPFGGTGLDDPPPGGHEEGRGEASLVGTGDSSPSRFLIPSSRRSDPSPSSPMISGSGPSSPSAKPGTSRLTR